MTLGYFHGCLIICKKCVFNVVNRSKKTKWNTFLIYLKGKTLYHYSLYCTGNIWLSQRLYKQMSMKSKLPLPNPYTPTSLSLLISTQLVSTVTMLAKWGPGQIPWWNILINMGSVLYSGQMQSEWTQKAPAWVLRGLEFLTVGQQD